MSEYDFIAIGDVTTDEFIELKKESAIVTKDLSGRDVLSMYFGDKLEFKGAINVPAVGNSPNAAVSAHRLGLKAALVADIGDDEGGQEILSWLRDKEGLDVSFIDVQVGKETNHHYVLRYGPERTILIKHETYEYRVPDMGTPKWLYFSSVGEHSLPYHHEIARYVREHPGVKLAFQPGSFQIQLGHETLKDIYEQTELLFCNKEEAVRILAKEESDIPTLLRCMRELGPKMPVITDGPRGAYVLSDEVIWHMPMYPDPAPPVDRTGAGDSFSSTFTAGLALGLDVPTALSWAPINSMSVVQYIGAQEGLLTRDKIEGYLRMAPADYKPTQL